MADNMQDTGAVAGGYSSGTYSGSPGAEFGGSVASEKASKFGRIARERLFKTADAQLGNLNQQLRGLTDRLESMSSEAGPEKRLIESGIGALRSVSSRIEGRSSEQLVREATQQMKEHPVTFLAGVCLLGFIGGRLVKV